MVKGVVDHSDTIDGEQKTRAGENWEFLILDPMEYFIKYSSLGKMLMKR